MQIVIDIDKELYKTAKEGILLAVQCSYMMDAIRNGTPLPKGHGRLIDVDAATKSIDAFHDSFVKECDMLSGKFSIVCTAPTVIEADREVENDD